MTLIDEEFLVLSETITNAQVQSSDINSRFDWIAVVRWLSVVVLALTLGMLTFPSLFSSLVNSRAQTLRQAKLESALINGTAPLGGLIAAGTPVALLEIPSIELRSAVVEGTQSEQLVAGPGHVTGSVLPGQFGVSAIMGRSSTFGAEFSRLDEIEIGEKIEVTTGQGVSTYEVLDATRRSESDSSAFMGEGNMLLLITSTGGTNPDGRLVVRAELTSPVLPVGEPNQSIATVRDLGLQGSQGAWTDLALWALVLVAVVLLRFPAQRWLGARVTWMIFAPVVALAAFQIFMQISLIAPSTY